MKPQIGTFNKLANALGIPVSELKSAFENRVEVLVGDYDPDYGEFDGEVLNFRGVLTKTLVLDEGERRLTLYTCPDGYRVHQREVVEGSLHPSRTNPNTGELEYTTYPTAEEVIEDYPEFRNTFGIYPVRYID